MTLIDFKIRQINQRHSSTSCRGDPKLLGTGSRIISGSIRITLRIGHWLQSDEIFFALGRCKDGFPKPKLELGQPSPFGRGCRESGGEGTIGLMSHLPSPPACRREPSPGGRGLQTRATATYIRRNAIKAALQSTRLACSVICLF